MILINPRNNLEDDLFIQDATKAIAHYFADSFEYAVNVAICRYQNSIDLQPIQVCLARNYFQIEVNNSKLQHPEFVRTALRDPAKFTKIMEVYNQTK